MLRRMAYDFLGEIAEGRRAPSIDNSKEGFSGERVLVGREEWSFFVNPLFFGQKTKENIQRIAMNFYLAWPQVGSGGFPVSSIT